MEWSLSCLESMCFCLLRDQKQLTSFLSFEPRQNAEYLNIIYTELRIDDPDNQIINSQYFSIHIYALIYLTNPINGDSISTDIKLLSIKG